MNQCLLATLVLVTTASTATAQVTEWTFAKGPLYCQTADNTAPASATEWGAFGSVETMNPTDATTVTISGGGIGTVPLLGGGGCWEIEAFFPTQNAMNAVVPSATMYTFTLSGGTLGTQTQTFQLGSEAYPNVPYTTGTVLTDIQTYNNAQNFTFTWNDPGPLTAASGVSILEIYDVFDDTVFSEPTVGGTTSALVPGGTLSAAQTYEGEIIFTNETSPSGAGGFGVNGRAGHITLTDFPMVTINAAVLATRNGGTNPSSYTATTPVLGNLWTGSVDLTTTGHSMARIVMHRNPATFTFATGQTVLVSGPRVLKLSLMAGPVASWSAVIPNDVSLANFTVYTQALHLLGVSPFALSNAQDLTFGS